MDRYDRIRPIGSGTFGNVFLVKSKLSRQTYVLKEVSLLTLNESEQQQALNEVSVLAKCRHRHIVSYKEAKLERQPLVLYIVMEYADGGDLSAAIQNQKGIPFCQNLLLSWFVEICLALQYIHHKNILHRDLKSQNVFLTKTKTIKVGDFGISRILKGPEDLAETSIGTPYYLSPEICQRKRYNHKSDMWALGCLLFEMAALEHAFDAKDFIHLMNLILKGKRKELPSHCSPLLHELVSMLLRHDPDERPSTSDLLAYPPLQTYLPDNSFENDREMALKNTQELNAKKGFKLFKSGLKRRASVSIVKPREIKQVNSPFMKFEPPSTETGSRFYKEPLKKPDKPIPLTAANNLRLKQQNVKKNAAPKVFAQDFKESKSKLTVSCDSINDLPSTFTVVCPLTTSEDTTLVKAGGSVNSLLTPNEAPMTSTLSAHCKKLFSFPMFRRYSDGSKEMSESINRNSSSGFIDASSSSKSNVNVSSSNHCKHRQCPQCVLDMLWRSRIRTNSETITKKEEYFELKEKLLTVFKKDLFEKMYQSLMQDWEKGDVFAPKSFQEISYPLTYEQMQSLPLMMQLIQLDLLMISQKKLLKF